MDMFCFRFVDVNDAVKNFRPRGQAKMVSAAGGKELHEYWKCIDDFLDFSLQAIIKVSNSFSATEIFAAPPQSFAQSYLVVCATSVRLQSDGR